MTAGFTGRLTITQLPSTSWRLWELHDPLVYNVGQDKSIIVPKGLVSDGPTVPRLLWALLPVLGRGARAGFLHDYLCAKIAVGHPHPLCKTRARADAFFLEAMKALGVGKLTRWLLYTGVRFGSWMGVASSTLDQNYHLLTARDKQEGGPGHGLAR